MFPLEFPSPRLNAGMALALSGPGAVDIIQPAFPTAALPDDLKLEHEAAGVLAQPVLTTPRSKLRTFAIMSALFVRLLALLMGRGHLAPLFCPAVCLWLSISLALTLHCCPRRNDRQHGYPDHIGPLPICIRLHVDRLCIPACGCGIRHHLGKALRHLWPQTHPACSRRPLLRQLDHMRPIDQYGHVDRWPSSAGRRWRWTDDSCQYHD